MLKDHDKRNIKAADERALVEDISGIGREREGDERRRTSPRFVLFSGKIYSPVTRSDVMPAARHNMKTLSALSRKAHSNCNVLSLAVAPGTCNAISRFRAHLRARTARCIATSGCQDFRWVLVSAGFVWPKSDLGQGERDAPEPICERNEGSR